MIILQEFTEIETGKGADALDRRPQLNAALALARQFKCPVVVHPLLALVVRNDCEKHGVGPADDQSSKQRRKAMTGLGWMDCLTVLSNLPPSGIAPSHHNRIVRDFFIAAVIYDKERGTVVADRNGADISDLFVPDTRVAGPSRCDAPIGQFPALLFILDHVSKRHSFVTGVSV
jgi:hypothetical protein